MTGNTLVLYSGRENDTSDLQGGIQRTGNSEGALIHFVFLISKTHDFILGFILHPCIIHRTTVMWEDNLC